MMLAKFRDRYPQGSLVSKLVQIDRGNFIVKVSIKVENITLVTALASASNVEAAEDAARARAITALCLDQQTTSAVSSPKFSKQIALVEPSQTGGENPITPKGQGSLVSNKVVRLAESETPSNYVPGKASTNFSESQVSDPEIAPSKSVQSSANLFEGTFAATSTSSSTLEGNQAFSKKNITDPKATNFEPDDNSVINAVTGNPPEKVTEVSANFDFTQVKQKTDIEIARLGWTRDDGREFLQSRYGKRSRLHLKDEELMEFLHYLEQLPTPVN